MTDLIALYLAGLSFFFTGMAGLSENLRRVTGQRFRILLSRATDHPVRAGLLGVAAGVVTQSSSVVAFILAGMIATGLLPLRRALIVLGCTNIGTAVVVFMAATDLQVPILYLIGISGLLLAFKLVAKWQPAISSLLSVGMLFFGLEMMKQAFLPISTSRELIAVARFFDRWPDSAFLLGGLLRSIIHSSAATAAITITINRGGLLGEFPALMCIAGLGLGTAVATYFLSSNLRGVPRQIAFFQMFTNIAAAAVLAILLLAEHATGTPLLMALVDRFSPSIAGRMAFLYLFFNVAIAGISIASLRWAPALLIRLSPPTPEEDLSRPMYLDSEALLSPETAPDRVALEQMRVMRVLAFYLDTARTGNGAKLKPLHAAAVALGGQIAQFLEALLKQPIGAELAAEIISLQRKEETLRSLEENMFLFSDTMAQRGGELEGRLVEALDTVLLTAIDAFKSKDAMDLEMLVGMTEDRGGMMEKLRSRYGLHNGGDAGHVAALHYATTLFERNVWLLRQLALWLREELGRVEV